MSIIVGQDKTITWKK